MKKKLKQAETIGQQDETNAELEVETVDSDDVDVKAEPGDTAPEKDPAIERLEQEAIHWQNRWALLKADFDNYKRRTQRQVEEIKGTANEELIGEMLPILDNFERALANAPADSNFAKGVQMIFDQLLQTLSNQGLQAIDSIGTSFDPAFHEAVSMEGSDGDGPLVVQQELQKGYMFKDKVLRASMVHVGNVDKGKEDDNNG